MNDPASKWSRLSTALRAQGVGQPDNPADLQAPPGFATRIVALSRREARAEATGLLLWRRWSLAGACAALLACGTLFAVHPPRNAAPQIIPVPSLEELQPPALPLP